MKNILLPLVLSLFLLASCSKELSLDSGGAPTLTTNLLVKIVYDYGDDSSQVEYSYDANKRLIGQKISGSIQGFTVQSEIRLVRNASGLITQIIKKDPNLVAGGIDSLVTVLNYDITAARYSSRVTRFLTSNVLITDSISLVYNSSGKLSREDEYIAAASLGNVYVPLSRTELTWDLLGNVSQVSYSEADISTGAPLQLFYVNGFTYDEKKNALQIPINEAYGTGFYDMAGPNNVLKSVYNDKISQTDSYTLDYLYEYNAKSKPASGVLTQTPDNATTGLRFTYGEF
jgi:hypothetical protein